jgi:ATP synthase protein I
MTSSKPHKKSNSFSDEIDNKERRKIKSLKEKKNNVWFGLGMMGVVGWSVAVPSLLGAMIGVWLDKRYPQSFSWVLSLLICGLIVGVIIAWYWIDKEDKEINKDNEK